MGELSQVVLVYRDGSWLFPRLYVIALRVCCVGVVFNPPMATDRSVSTHVDDVVKAPQASLRPLLAVVHRQSTPDTAALA
ncbi:Uncharacterised protein [Mycobacteroides abscessus subsp. massiliense]|nr:Uncharacterised protein [Mycobacteroides abscessus subsp. massiliense]SKU96730.1 Uncharacterised protein [Mycobacteroides abscessus subsp. massiliense]